MFNRAFLIVTLFFASVLLGVFGFDHLSASVSRLFSGRQSTMEDVSR